MLRSAMPHVFISYSHDSVHHKKRVLALSNRLHQHGVDCSIDQDLNNPPEGFPRWTIREIQSADFVLLVCTESYRRRFDGDVQPGVGRGATWEGSIITQELYNSQPQNTKFIPIVFESADIEFIPTALQGNAHYDLSQGEEPYRLLLHRLTGKPPSRKTQRVQSEFRSGPEPRLTASGTAGATAIEAVPIGPEPTYGPSCFVSRDHPQYIPGLLVVFVHGVNSSATSCWGLEHAESSDREQKRLSLPECLAEAWGVQFDWFGYEYPSKFLQRIDLETAASVLKGQLRAGFQRQYAEYVFVTHSAGGLVVKQLLLDDLCGRLVSHDPQLGEQSISGRTRYVANIAVPHRGAAPGLTEIARKILAAAQYVLLPFATLLRVASVGTINAGRNSILNDLRSNNPKLDRMESEYLDAISRCDELGVPRPVSIELIADGEVAANPTYRERVPATQADGLRAFTDRNEYVLRGTHTSVHVPARQSDFIVRLLAQQVQIRIILEDARRSVAGAVRAGTISRSTEFEGSARHPATKLIGTSNPDLSSLEDVDKDTANWEGGSQAFVLSRLMKICSPPAGFKSVVVTGGVGVGKSVVLRRLARDLAQNTSSSDSESPAPLPIFIPMGRIEMAAFAEGDAEVPDVESRDWNNLLDCWARWVGNLVGDGLVEVPQAVRPFREIGPWWFRWHLLKRPTIVMLDGVDEFLVRRAGYGKHRFVSMLRWVNERYSVPGVRLVVVLGVRCTEPELESFVSSRNDILAVHRMTRASASRWMPELEEHLESFSKDDLRFLLTPLILSHLQPGIAWNDGLRTHAGMLEMALRGMLQWSHVEDKERAINCSMMIAWQMFRLFSEEGQINTLTTEAKKCVEDWTTHFKELSETGKHSEEATSLLPGFDDATDPERLKPLLRATVFFPTRSHAIGFNHQQWEDYLVARYLAVCLRTHFVDELRHRAFDSRHFGITGSLLRGFVVERDLVEHVLHRTRVLRERFVFGNFVAWIGHSRTAVSSAAVKLLVASLDDIDPLARHVSLTLLGWRGLANAADDPAALELRAVLLDELPRFMSRQQQPFVPAVTASMAWCHLRAFLGRQNSAGISEWPGLSEDDADEVVSWSADLEHPDAEPSAQFRSLQVAYLTAQQTIPSDPNRGITALHYLFLLCSAWKNQVHIPEVGTALGRLLADDSHVSTFVRTYDVVPELRDVFSVCQRIYRRRLGQA